MPRPARTMLPYALEFSLWLEERRLPRWHARLSELIERAPSVTAEQVGEMRAVENIVRKKHLASPHVAPLLAEFIKSGAIWGDPASADAAWMAPLAIQSSDEAVRALARDSRWRAASGPEAFEPGSSAAALAASDWKGEPWLADSARDASLNFGWGAQFLEAQSRSRRRQESLLEQADAAGRLKELRRGPRGAAWLMHCLVSGHPGRAQAALGAGIDLKSVGPKEAQAFREALASAALPRIEGKLRPRQARAPQTPAQEAVQAEWALREAEEKRRRWSWAVEAGLPAQSLAQGVQKALGAQPLPQGAQEGADAAQARPAAKRAARRGP